MFLVAAALVMLAQDAPVQSDFDAPTWFRNHLKDFSSARIEQIKPPTKGVWKTGTGGILTSALLPRREEHLAIFHCWRVTAPNTRERRFLLVEGPNGTLITSKTSGSALEKRCS
jgi:hypothetical protein